MKEVNKLFRVINDKRIYFHEYCLKTKELFINYLNREENDKIKIIGNYIEEFNKIENKERDSSKTKLTKRSDEIRDTLWETCDQRREENEKWIEENYGNAYVLSNGKEISEIYKNLIQIEINK